MGINLFYFFEIIICANTVLSIQFNLGFILDHYKVISSIVIFVVVVLCKWIWGEIVIHNSCFLESHFHRLMHEI